MLSGNLENQSIIMVDNYTLENMISNQESFVLTIMLSTCSTCEAFKTKVLNPYIEKTSANIYGIDFLSLDEYKNYENKPYVKEAPALLFYSEGKIMETLKYEYGKKEFMDLKQFEEYMNEFVISPKLVSISEKILDRKIEDLESFVLYIGWNKCGDCKLLESQILNQYLIDSNSNNVMYYLESDEYRKNKPAKEPIESDFTSIEEYNLACENWNKWIDFATKYQFVDFRNGKIPTIQYYEKGVLKQSIVYHNDVIENGKVVTSFFEECKDKTMSEDELLKYHNQKVMEFLNKYYLK